MTVDDNHAQEHATTPNQLSNQTSGYCRYDIICRHNTREYSVVNE